MTTSDPAAILVHLLHAVDQLDWAGMKEAFADEVRSDYTSLSGGAPQIGPVDDLIAQWRTLLPGFDATQHLLGAPLVSIDADQARVDAHVRAHHWLNNAVWTVYGHYACGLVNGPAGWRVASLTLTVFHQDGGSALAALATARAGRDPRS
jgi:SnoaL-like domain